MKNELKFKKVMPYDEDKQATIYADSPENLNKYLAVLEQFLADKNAKKETGE